MTAALIFVSRDVPTKNGYQPTKAVNGTSALQRLVITCRLAGIETIVALTPQRLDISQHLARMHVFCIGSEISADMNHMEYMEQAIAFLKGKCSQVLLLRPESPLFLPDTVKKLLSAGQLPAAAEYGGSLGLPLLVKLQELSLLGRGLSLEEALCALMNSSQKIRVDDPLGSLRLDQEDTWREAMGKWRVNELRPIVKCMVARECVFLGPGTRQLLESLDETGSLRNACAQIGISYSKGRRMVFQIEQQTGFQVITRQKGGREGGSSRLTPLGRDLLDRYTAFENACTSAMQSIFDRYFMNYQEGTPHENLPM